MIAAAEILCPECTQPIDPATVYHEVQVIDPDEGPARMLAACGVCDRCGDVFLRNASGDF